MKILFLLKTGMIEWQVPENLLPTFHFPAMVTTTRVNGFFLADTLYIRHDELVGMSIAGETPVVKPMPAETLQ